MVVVFIIEGVDEFGDGHQSTPFHGVALLCVVAPEADFVGVRHIDLGTDKAVLGAVETGGD